MAMGNQPSWAHCAKHWSTPTSPGQRRLSRGRRLRQATSAGTDSYHVTRTQKPSGVKASKRISSFLFTLSSGTPAYICQGRPTFYYDPAPLSNAATPGPPPLAHRSCLSVGRNTYPWSLRGGWSRRSNPLTGWEIASPPVAARNDVGG